MSPPVLNFLVLIKEQLAALCYINVSQGKESGNLVVRCRWLNTAKKDSISAKGMIFTSCIRCWGWYCSHKNVLKQVSSVSPRLFSSPAKEPTDLHKTKRILEIF